MSSGKRWVLFFVLILFTGMAVYMAVCYRANPLAYFTNEKGLDYYDPDGCGRKIKLQYIHEHHDEIEGVLIGGSKSGAIEPAVMTEITGKKYYNMYIKHANFRDYLNFITFLVKECGIRDICFVLSSFETEGYNQEWRGNAYQTPAIVKGSLFARLTETLSYLMTDLDAVIEMYQKPYDETEKIVQADCIYDGMYNRFQIVREFQEDPDQGIQVHVLDRMKTKLPDLFAQDAASQETVRTQNLNAMKEIVRLCRENDVALHVIAGPCFLAERARFECREYYHYFDELVRICGEIWDFSDYNDISMNPYNFYDYSHYSKEVAELMVRTVFEEGFSGRAGFGKLLNAENVGEAMVEREKKFKELKKEYKETGTVQLGKMEDDSYLPWAEQWFSSGILQSPAIQRAREEYMAKSK